MQNRDKVILWIAIICGLMAFLLVTNLLKKSSSQPGSPQLLKASTGTLPIPAGMRALTLTTKEVANIPDLLVVGGFVDILGTVPNYEGKMELQTVFRGARVISMETKKEDGARSVTVALTPIGAEVVTKALSQSKVSLLQRADDNDGGVLQLGGVGFTEVIRGVQKEKNMRVEK